MVAMKESIFPRLIVPASHTALSGDLTVIIFDLQSLDPKDTLERVTASTTATTITASTTTTTIKSISTTDLSMDVDNEEYNLNENEDLVQGPYVLRSVYNNNFQLLLNQEFTIR